MLALAGPLRGMSTGKTHAASNSPRDEAAFPLLDSPPLRFPELVRGTTCSTPAARRLLPLVGCSIAGIGPGVLGRRRYVNNKYGNAFPA